MNPKDRVREKADWAAAHPPIIAEQILGMTFSPQRKPQVKVYDFRRPDKFSKDQIRTVSIMHDTFARLTTTSLSAQLRSLVHIRVASVDQLTYEEFIRSIPNPATLAVINMDPLKGSAILEIDPSLTFSMIDRLFGGKGKETKLSRDLTDIEQSVMEGIIVRVLGNIREAWSTVIDLKPRLGQIETNPQFAQIVPPTEMIILVTFEAGVEGVSGLMNFVIPYLTIEPVISKLSAQYWYSSVRYGKPAVSRDVSGLKSDARVFFEAQPLSLADVSRLKKNSLVKLDDSSTAFLSVGRKTVCRFTAKRERGRYAFTVRETGGQAAADELPAVSGARRDETARLENLVQAPLERLRREIHNTWEAIIAKMGEMKKRQEELDDQLFQNGRENAACDPEGNTGLEESGRPFSFINATEPEAFFNFLIFEHPQAKALILSFIDPARAADFLARLPEEEQADVAERIATLGRCAPAVILAVERVLKKKLLWLNQEKAYRQDSDTIISILNVVERKVENNVISRLEKSNPELAERIKRRLFVFEDTILLDKSVIKKLLPRLNPTDLLLALKAVNDKTKEHFLANMEPAARKKFADDFQSIGPVRIVDAEKAQQRIIGVIRQMEEAGEIVVAHPDDMIVE